MIASTPVRLGSLLVLAFVVPAGVKGISSGICAGGGLFEGDGLGRGVGGTGKSCGGKRSLPGPRRGGLRRGDTVRVTTATDGRAP